MKPIAKFIVYKMTALPPFVWDMLDYSPTYIRKLSWQYCTSNSTSAKFQGLHGHSPNLLQQHINLIIFFELQHLWRAVHKWQHIQCQSNIFRDISKTLRKVHTLGVWSCGILSPSSVKRSASLFNPLLCAYASMILAIFVVFFTFKTKRIRLWPCENQHNVFWRWWRSGISNVMGRVATVRGDGVSIMNGKLWRKWYRREEKRTKE